MKTITVEELKARMDGGEELNLVDVREPYENADFNIGGRLVPLGQIQMMDIDDLDAMKQQEIIVYCRSGNRSGQACHYLEAAGFNNVKNLIGGMLQWREKLKV